MDLEALEIRKNRAGEVLLGASFVARVLPFIKFGAPILAVVLLPATYLMFASFGPVFSVVLALALTWVVLNCLAVLGLGLTHRVWLWNIEQGKLRLAGMGSLWVASAEKEIQLAQIERVEENFSPQAASILRLRNKAVPVPFAAWDALAFNALRRLKFAVEGKLIPSRYELLAADAKARLKYENPQLARQYGMNWKAEFEDPSVFLKAFDEHRQAMTKKRK